MGGHVLAEQQVVDAEQAEEALSEEGRLQPLAIGARGEGRAVLEGEERRFAAAELHLLAAGPPEGRLELAVEAVVQREKAAQLVPVFSHHGVEAGLRGALVAGVGEGVDEELHLVDDHVQRRRLQRLHEGVGVPDREDVLRPALAVAPRAEVHHARVTHPRILAAHLLFGCVDGEEGRREDVAAVILLGRGDVPAPACFHALREGVREDVPVVRDVGHHGGVAVEARRPALEGHAQRLVEQQRAEARRVEVEIEGEALALAGVQARDASVGRELHMVDEHVASL